MAARDSFAEFLREQLAPLGPITLRRMFGTIGLFCDGRMFGLVSDGALFLRVDDGNRAAFGSDVTPLGYTRRGRPAELPYWRAPEHLFDEPEDLLAWARAALAAARRVRR